MITKEEIKKDIIKELNNDNYTEQAIDGLVEIIKETIDSEYYYCLNKGIPAFKEVIKEGQDMTDDDHDLILAWWD